MTVVLGLTGSFGSGKSTVAAMFRDCGFPAADADDFAREAVAPGSEALAEIRRTFGEGVLAPDGSLDREAMAARVFASREDREQLGAIVHPRVRVAMDRFVAAHPEAPAVILEIPLLFETGRDAAMDGVIVVTATERARFGRLKARGFTERQIVARLGAQMAQSRKAARAGHVIDNGGSVGKTKKQVEEIAARYGAPPPGG